MCPIILACVNILQNAADVMIALQLNTTLTDLVPSISYLSCYHIYDSTICYDSTPCVITHCQWSTYLTMKQMTLYISSRGSSQTAVCFAALWVILCTALKKYVKLP